MVETLQEVFQRAIVKYLVPDESDDEITIEYNIEKKKSKSHSKHKKSSKTTDVSDNSVKLDSYYCW